MSDFTMQMDGKTVKAKEGMTLLDAARAAGKQVLLPVHPGLDNSKFNPKPYVIPRREGQTLRDFFRAADEAGADLIAITSFNEWPETTVIIRFWLIAAVCVAAALGLFIGDFTRISADMP